MNPDQSGRISRPSGRHGKGGRRLARPEERLRLALNMAFAFGAAVLIWAGVGARLSTQIVINVPIELVAPEGLACRLRRRPGAGAAVTFAGPAEALAALRGGLRSERVVLRPEIRLTPEDVGERILEGHVLELDPARDVVLPERFLGRIRVVECRPGALLLDVAPVVERVLPVQVVTAGEPSLRADQTLAALNSQPERVSLRGSLMIFRELEQNPDWQGVSGAIVAPTRPLALAGISRSVRRPIGLALPDGVTAKPDTVTVSLTVRRVIKLETRRFELTVRFLVPAPLKDARVLEPRRPDRRITVELEAERAVLDDFAKRLEASDPRRHPFAFVRVAEDLQPGPQSGELEIGNFDPSSINLRGDRTFLFTVREPRKDRR